MGFLKISGSDSVPIVCERFLEQNRVLIKPVWLLVSRT